MKLETLLNRWAEIARLEDPPAVAVTEQVAAIVRTIQAEEFGGGWSLEWIAIFSVCVALPVAWVALTMWTGWTDPLMGLITDLPWGLL